MKTPVMDFDPGGNLEMVVGENHTFNCSIAEVLSAGRPRLRWRVGE